jgi:hypothetical protein
VALTRDGAAVHAPQQPGLGELLEVAAHGVPGDVHDRASTAPGATDPAMSSWISLESREQSVSWELGRGFILRQAGFAFGQLDRTAASDAVERARALHERISVASRVRSSTLAALRDWRPGAARSVLREELRAAVRDGAPIMPALLADVRTRAGEVTAVVERWNLSVEDVDACATSFTRSYKDALHVTVRNVLELLRRDDLQQVILLSNDAHFDVFARWLARQSGAEDITGWRDMRMVNKLVMYLQRACAKNATTSHFGPFSVGTIGDGPIGVSWSGEGPLMRRATFTHWAAQELARIVHRHRGLRGQITPRRQSGAFLSGSRLEVWGFDEWWVPGDGLSTRSPVDLSGDEAALLACCDGATSIAELWETWSPEAPSAAHGRFWRALERLADLGALTLDLEIPVGCAEPLDYLIAHVPPGTPELEDLERFRRGVASFASLTGIEQRRAVLDELKSGFTGLTTVAASRGYGRFYADRTILYEECLRPLEGLQVAGPVRSVLERSLPLALDLILIAPTVRLREQRAVMTQWYVNRFGPNRRLSLASFLRQWRDDVNELARQYAQVEEEVERAERILYSTLVRETRAEAHCIELEAAEVAEFLTRWGQRERTVCNPDIHIAATSPDAIRRGDFALVIGECHAFGRDVVSHMSVSAMMVDAEPAVTAGARELYEVLARPGEVVADVLRHHSDKTFVQLNVAPLDVEVGGRSPKARAEVVALHELEVVDDSGELRLFCPRLDLWIALASSPLLAPDRPLDPFRVFGFPLLFSGALGMKFASHVPRLTLGRLVVARETWRIPARLLLEPVGIGRSTMSDRHAAAFVRANELRGQLGLPRRVFVGVPGEPSSIFVDFDSPLLTRQLTRLAGRERESMITVTEMLPAPEQLWLASSDGVRTSELRLTAIAGCR